MFVLVSHSCSGPYGSVGAGKGKGATRLLRGYVAQTALTRSDPDRCLFPGAPLLALVVAEAARALSGFSQEELRMTLWAVLWRGS